MNNSSLLSQLQYDIPKKALENVPYILKPFFKLIPDNVRNSLFLKMLNSIFTESIEDGELDFLKNKWLKISIPDLGLCWFITYNNEQLIVESAESNRIEDVTFSANGDDLLLIAGRKEDPDTLFFQRRLKIEGDTELGLAIKNLIDAIDLDNLPGRLHKTVDTLALWVQKIKH